MSGPINIYPDLSKLVDGTPMTPGLVARLVAVALAQANAVALLLEESVLPVLPAGDRAFAQNLVRKFARGAILEENFLGTLHAFIDIMDDRISAGTHRYWHGDEHHVRGGYEAIHRELDVLPLAQARMELASLTDMVLAASMGARALRDTQAFLES